MNAPEETPQRRISFDIVLTVFLRTFLAAVGGAVAAYLVIAIGNALHVLDGSEIVIVTPILSIAAGVWYISFAKKTLGDHWGIGISGILGMVAVFVLLFFVLAAVSM